MPAEWIARRLPVRLAITWGPTEEPATAAVQSAPEPTDSAASVLFQVAMQRLMEQLGRSDSLDSRAIAALTFGGAILPITFGVLGLATLNQPHHHLVHPALYSGLACYLLVVALYARALLGYRNFSLRPHMPTFEELTETNSGHVMQRWAARECLLSMAENEPKLGRKARIVGRAFTIVVVETLLLSIAAGVALF